MDSHHQKNIKKNKFNYKKDCTIKSIKEIEYFLCNLNKGIKSFKIYKFIK